MFVMWNWAWLEEMSSSNDDSSVCSNNVNVTEELQDTSDDDTREACAIPPITHSVVFKCIGNLKEHRYQELLALAKKKINEGVSVQVNIKKEPNNPMDSRAISFVCDVTGSWERIGYVVQEALNEIHKAMDDNLILKVQFDWIKYIVHFKNPGWYTGIKITRSGEWSQTVLRSRSTLCY